MYSRNKWEHRDNSGYSLPPGYDGSRFRRRRRQGNQEDDEVILIPDSDFTATDIPRDDIRGKGELSVSGIPTERGLREKRHSSAIAENTPPETEFTDDVAETAHTTEESTAPKEKLSGILNKLGFSGGLSSDELLLCAVIFIIASDNGDDGKSIGDILLILALLLGIR